MLEIRAALELTASIASRVEKVRSTHKTIGGHVLEIRDALELSASSASRVNQSCHSRTTSGRASSLRSMGNPIRSSSTIKASSSISN